ncbi:hypothetical protein GCM10023188_13050 [Pontibacter saemangeumensis]|uniref:Secretion system C-terminal sorting domain-containing protein n=1 Tax=Pontibacter saemangeumensis TaxID=1084525 RepID=A0ABP8LI53_9BACT
MSKLFTRFSHIGMAIFMIYAVLFSEPAAAQVSMQRDITTYTQDFNSLPAAKDGIWESGTSYMEGWYVQRTKAGNAIVVSPGNLISGNLYSFGAVGSTERALGAQSSLLMGEFAWGLLLQNNTGAPINFIDISFYGEQWRISNKTAGEHKTTFHYAVSSDKTTFKLSPKSEEGWIPFPDLDFRGPHFYTEGKALNGNAAANRRHLSALIAVTIPVGHYLMLRWKDADELEADHGLAIDDFSLTWTLEEVDGPVVVLPVELARFSAFSKGTAVSLKWLTASEDQNDYFLIERSADGLAFEEIGKADGKGTTVLETEYAYTDEQPLAGTSYYRLKQVDEDGSFTFSKVVAVSRGGNAVVSKVYPTVTTDFLQLDLAQDNTVKAALVMDMLGRELVQESLTTNTRQHSVDVRGLSTGTYLLVLLDAQGQRQATRFIKK